MDNAITATEIIEKDEKDKIVKIDEISSDSPIKKRKFTLKYSEIKNPNNKELLPSNNISEIDINNNKSIKLIKGEEAHFEDEQVTTFDNDNNEFKFEDEQVATFDNEQEFHFEDEQITTFEDDNEFQYEDEQVANFAN